MKSYAFRLLNVFADATFHGNPLCVFEDANGLDEATMQALALQFNLSETTFIFPSEQAAARVRIFTTGYEMPFAGHPTLGTAHVVRDLMNTGDRLTLEFKAGIVPVWAEDGRWTFTAPHVGMPRARAEPLPQAEMAGLLGLRPDDLAGEATWVDTGADQLLIPVRTAEAVRRAAPDSTRLDRWPASSLGRKTAYVFALDAPTRGEVLSRYFFTKQGGGVEEDPGTGSACANLGGWLLLNARPLPASYHVSQGQAVGRPCQLHLRVNEAQEIQVGGRVIELGRGTVNL